jgi:hypothetical protein
VLDHLGRHDVSGVAVTAGGGVLATSDLRAVLAVTADRAMVVAAAGLTR